MTDYGIEKKHLLHLLKTFAFEKRDVTLSSGARSNFYLDCRQVSFLGEAQALLGELLFEWLCAFEKKHGVVINACAGVELGAVPLVCALSMLASQYKRSLPGLVIRKEIKQHGTQTNIEGSKHVPGGSKVLLLEDVITTGKSTLYAHDQLLKQGYDVEAVLCVVDRKMHSAQLRQAGLKLFCLYDVSDFLEETDENHHYDTGSAESNWAI